MRGIVSITGTLYDGRTSVANHVLCLLNEEGDALCVQDDAGTVREWRFPAMGLERFGSVMEIRNDAEPGVLLVIDDVEFARALWQVRERHGHIGIPERFLRMSTTSAAVVALVVLGTIVMEYLYALPVMAEKSVALVPLSADDAIGNAFASTLIDGQDIDTMKTEALRRFAARMNLSTTKPLMFTVVRSGDVNAYALPNGRIVVNSAIVDMVESPAELAALLGHEVSHIKKRHSTRLLCRNLAGYMIVSFVMGDVTGVVSVLADNARMLHSLAFSREYEQAADEQGLRILVMNRLDPHGMVRLFEHLERLPDPQLHTLLSSHPITKDRRENMQRIISGMRTSIAENRQLSELFCALKK